MNDMSTAVIIALLLINLVGLLLVGYRAGKQQDDTRVMDRRLSLLEARVEHLPTHRDLAGLRENLQVVVENVASIHGQTDIMTQLLKTIQEHLLERENRR